MPFYRVESTIPSYTNRFIGIDKYVQANTPREARATALALIGPNLPASTLALSPVSGIEVMDGLVQPLTRQSTGQQVTGFGYTPSFEEEGLGTSGFTGVTDPSNIEGFYGTGAVTGNVPGAQNLPGLTGSGVPGFNLPYRSTGQAAGDIQTPAPLFYAPPLPGGTSPPPVREPLIDQAAALKGWDTGKLHGPVAPPVFQPQVKLGEDIPGIGPLRTAGDIAETQSIGTPTGAIMTGFTKPFDPTTMAEDATRIKKIFPQEVLPEDVDSFATSSGTSAALASAGMDTIPSKAKIAVITGNIRPWAERVKEINVTGTPGSNFRVELPEDMFQFDEGKNRIGGNNIKQVMEHLAASEGRDSYNAAVNNFLRQALDYFKANSDLETTTGLGLTRKDYVDQALVTGNVSNSAWFKEAQQQILDDVIGAREKEIEDNKPIGDEDTTTFDSLNPYWQKNFDKFQNLDLDLKKIAANHDLPTYYNQRPQEYALLSPHLKAQVISGNAIDAKTLEPYALAEAKAAGFDTGGPGEGTGTYKPEDKPSLDPTAPGNEWMLDDDAIVVDDLDDYVGPEGGGKPPVTNGGFTDFTNGLETDTGMADFELAGTAKDFDVAAGAMEGWQDPVPVPGAGTVGVPAFSSQDLINDPQGFLTAAGQRLALRNVFGEPATGVGPLASYLQRQTYPLTDAYRAGGFANIAREQAGEIAPQTTFEDFLTSVRDQPTGLGGAYGQALQNVNYLRGLGGSQVPTALAGVFSPEQAANTRDARALLQAAQRGKYSGLVSRSFRRPTEDDLFSDYVLAKQDAATAGTAPQNFLNFAASRYGL